MSDVDFSVHYDYDYSTKNNKDPPLSDVVETSVCVNMSNAMISDGSMREMIRSLNPQQGQTFDEVYVKENVLEIH